MPVFTKQLGTMDYSSPETIKSIANHIRVMQEELEYRLMFLDSSNISEINADQTNIFTSKGGLIQLLNETDKSVAELSVKADEISMSVEDANKNIAAVNLRAQNIELSVQNANDDIAAINLRAESIESSVEDANDNISKIEQYAKSITMSVSNGETSSTLTLKAGETVLTSQNITFNGVVTFKGLQEGTTTIDGAWIKTGTITIEDLDSSTQSAINNAAPRYQYSADGSSNWHSTMQSTDYYRRESYDGGTTWGSVYQFRGKNGQNGKDGEPGKNAEIPIYISETIIGKGVVQAPQILANDVSLYPNNQSDYTGSFNIFGMQGSGQYHMLAIQYEGHADNSYSPSVDICSPGDAFITFNEKQRLGEVRFYGTVDFSNATTKGLYMRFS